MGIIIEQLLVKSCFRSEKPHWSSIQYNHAFFMCTKLHESTQLYINLYIVWKHLQTMYYKAFLISSQFSLVSAYRNFEEFKNIQRCFTESKHRFHSSAIPAVSWKVNRIERNGCFREFLLLRLCKEEWGDQLIGIPSVTTPKYFPNCHWHFCCLQHVSLLTDSNKTGLDCLAEHTLYYD